MEKLAPSQSDNPTGERNAAQEKWGDALQAGFQVVPNILIQAHRALHLDPLDVLIVLNLNMHWWEARNLPYPKPSMIAERLGVATRTVERRIKKLEKAELVERLPAELLGRRSVKRFRLDGLVQRLTDLAKKAVASRGRSRPEPGEDSG